MKKVGIITELSLASVNYGNRIQAYALNKYLGVNYPQDQIETLVLDMQDESILTSKFRFYMSKLQRLGNFINKKIEKHAQKPEYFAKRLQKFNSFTRENNTLSDPYHSIHALEKSDFDAFFVGSDVVWAQYPGVFNRPRFLDFETGRSFLKFSYAASFGHDYIPKENISYIQKSLSSFSAISVREKSSVNLLKSIGVGKAVNVCDPSLLITSEEWKKLEKKPDVEMNDKFAFYYLLGYDKVQRRQIYDFCHKNGLKLVGIAFANGVYDEKLEEFADVFVNDCSPEEWLWLIDHAEVVLTDSFHGLALSSILGADFLVVKRANSSLGNRLLDYLKTIHQEDKFTSDLSTVRLENMVWDHALISEQIYALREKSIGFIAKCMKMVEEA